jgi:hypothetical protein
MPNDLEARGHCPLVHKKMQVISVNKVVGDNQRKKGGLKIRSSLVLKFGVHIFDICIDHLVKTPCRTRPDEACYLCSKIS